MRLKTFRTFNGEFAVYTKDFSRPSRRSQQLLAFFLGAAIVTLLWLWSGTFHHTDYQALRAYADMYANNIK